MYFNAQRARIPGLRTASHGWVSTYLLSQNVGRVKQQLDCTPRLRHGNQRQVTIGCCRMDNSRIKQEIRVDQRSGGGLYWRVTR